jgi:ribosome maturation factor RimP
MDKERFVSGLKIILEGYLGAKGMVLVDIICRYEGSSLIISILADKACGGITLGECTALNREIMGIIDQENIVQDNYILEVSSPGLDRPLKVKNDFLRCLKKKARFFFNQEIGGKFELEGVIDSLNGDSLFIQVGADIVEVPLSKINRAKQVF